MSGFSCTTCGSPLSEGAKFCTSCGNPIRSSRQFTSEAHLSSNASVSRKGISGSAKITYTLLILALFGIFVVIFMSHLPGGSHPVIANQPDVVMASMFTDVVLAPEPISVQVVSGKITFPLSELLAKKMVEFDYHSDNVTIPLLA
ncbi:MAG: zinc-ribbon domain-containing protein, partial [Ignavibacteria bacterium]|nr:zinc-ribbon domain-containing protein [Ignavibacteria bacterium]